MATVATQTVTSSGLNPTPATASAGGDKVRPGSILRVINGGASPITLTVVTPQTVDGDLAVADRTVAVPNAEFRYVKVTDTFSNRSDGGLVALTWSATTSVTFEVIA